MSKGQVSSRESSASRPAGRGASVLGRVALLWAAYAVRVAGLQAQGLWRDEVDQWRFAFEPLRELLANFTRPGWNGPLFSPMLRGWFALTGQSIYAMRMFPVLWGVLSVAAAYVLARRLAGRRVAAMAAVLLAASPYMVWYAQEIKMYTWVPLLALLALYALHRACERPRAGLWVGVWAATTLAVYSHILAALLIPVLVLWFLVHPRRHSRAWIGGLAVLAGLTLPYLPLLRWQSAIAFVPRDTGFPSLTLGQMVAALLTAWSAGVTQGPWQTPPVMRLAELWLVGLALVGAVGTVAEAVERAEPWARSARILRGEAAAATPEAGERARLLRLAGSVARSGRRRVLAHLATLVMLLVWLGVPLLAVWGVSLWSPIFTDRYLIWTAPACAILVAAGVDTLRRGLRQAAAGWVREPVARGQGDPTADELRRSAANARRGFAGQGTGAPWAVAIAGRVAYGALIPLLVLYGHGIYAQAAYPVNPQFDRVATILTAARQPGDLLLFQIPYNYNVVAYYAGADATQTNGELALVPWAKAPYTNRPGDKDGYEYGPEEVAYLMRGIVAGYDRVWLIYSEATSWDARELVKQWLDTTYVQVSAQEFQGVSLYLYQRPPR